MKCKALADLLRNEKPELELEFIRHKYFLSQQLGHNVGIRSAETDFIDKHLDDWARGYKDCYCELVCKYKKVCELRREYTQSD